MARQQTKGQEGVLTKERAEAKEPPMFKVILLNDDYTTMEFVVLVLESVFNKTRPEAERIMFNVHQQGSGIAGVYTKEIAETKTANVHQLSRQNEFPLRCVVEAV
jgi:ATP-dependent Clp protease adaptor protein ClpS